MKNMTEILVQRIKNLEEQLRIAILNSDTEVLSELLGDELIFTNHEGTLVSKMFDIQSHQRDQISIKNIIHSEQAILHYGNHAIASTRVHINGYFMGKLNRGDYRFMRVWSEKKDRSWQVVAAQSTRIIEPRPIIN